MQPLGSVEVRLMESSRGSISAALRFPVVVANDLDFSQGVYPAA